MGSEYDRKFEEMKKYIPFLESMIKRLESNTSSSNPRQAQLDKIRSLRDLLLDKKKRMKMDNLLKCEQVLVNLYAKVEQKDTLPIEKVESSESRASKDNQDLEAVRNKLKSVVKMQAVNDTLPEIARASEREENCEPGSKEPALFQRRPNVSVSDTRSMSKSYEKNIYSTKSPSKRNYTRVLVSPEPRTARWSASEDVTSEKPLFSRRSPRSPKRISPTYHKKERKKVRPKQGKLRKDLNITLKVPEESLHSLNTEDIVSRIMNCSDSDVDINTLSKIRSQILGELKKTGTNDDISEFILKSYNNKTKSTRKKKHEVEEGEISDSESETIENIYGSLVVMDKDQKSGHGKNSSDKGIQQRKIQICLVINADKEGESQTTIDLSESGVFDSKSQDILCIDSDESLSPTKIKNYTEINQTKNQENYAILKEDNEDKVMNPEKTKENKNESTESAKIEAVTRKPTDTMLNLRSESQDLSNEKPISPTKNIKTYSPTKNLQNLSPVKDKLFDKNVNESTKNVANFYKSQPENEDETISNILEKENRGVKPEEANDTALPTNQLFSANKIKDSTEIPLLSEPVLPPKAEKSVMSEIDILQALKNEILSETSVAISATEADTPALHQPKITKVAAGTDAGTAALQPKVTKPSSSNNISKKRISIENYKKKSESVAKSLFVKKRINAAREEIRKQSLKLTDKECERFKCISQLGLQDDADDISDDGDDLLDDDDDDDDPSLDDIYGDLAPKSPDQDNFSDDLLYPVLIPGEPVKASETANSVTDVDMRSSPTTSQPVSLSKQLPSTFINVALTQNTETPKIDPLIESNKKVTDGRKHADPRLRRDASQSVNKNSPLYGVTSMEGTPKATQFSTIVPLLQTPIYTPSYTPSMTPKRTPNARTFEMTPSHQSFENEEPQRKHVYAPSFSISDNRDREFLGSKEGPIWEPNDDRFSRTDVRSPRWESPRSASVQRDSQANNYKSKNDKFYGDRRDHSGFSSQDRPTTPGPSFGWGDRPSTPSHQFGRSECPPTPTHPFGRSECPSTPSHPFGRSECPPTPSHPFGRSECPPTPNHPFGRSECPLTPSHPFGRSDIKDPRLNRTQPDYDPRRQHRDKDRRYQRHSDYEPRNQEEKDCGFDQSYNRSNSYKSDMSRGYDRERRSDRYSNEQGSRYYKSNNTDPPRRFDREHSIGSTDRKNFEEPGRGFDRARREPSLNRSLSREDNSRLFTRTRDNRDSRYYDHHEEAGSWRKKKDKSIGKDLPKEPLLVFPKSTSVGKCQLDNSLSIKPKSGSSFDINTSVNATFQNIFESGKGIQVFDYTFDARRQRASSVGRTLVRENSVGQMHSHIIKQHEAKYVESPCFQRRNNFQRASSVGRTLASDKAERSFKEIKADFEAYRSNTSKSNRKLVIANIKEYIEPVSCSKNECSEESQITKQKYSPRRNYRDPRMRKDQKSPKNRNDRSSINSGSRRHSGIVYSSDNIAKGTIMGTGFGVKNYKIPKIKRPEPERPKTPIDEVTKMPEKTPKADTALESDIKRTEKIYENDCTVSTKTLKTHARRFSEETEIDRNNKSNISDNDNTVKLKVTKQKYNKMAVVSDDSENSDIDIKVIKLKHTRKAIISDGDSDNEYDTKNKQKITNKQDKKIVVTSNDDSDKRVTRSSRRESENNKPLLEPGNKTKRNRKTTIDETENEIEMKTYVKSKPINSHEKLPVTIKPVINEVITETKLFAKSEKSVELKLNKGGTKTSQYVAKPEKEPKKSLEEDSLDSSLGIDDIEIFSDNIVSDPVIDNINDLIADLDQDLRAVKSTANLNDNFTTEMKIIGEIESHEENTLGDISDLIEKDLNESNGLKQAHDIAINKEIELDTGNQSAAIKMSDIVPYKEQISQNNVQLNSTTKEIVPVVSGKKAKDPQTIVVDASNDEIVSTSDNNPINVIDRSFEINDVPSNNIDQSVPDSTHIPSDDIAIPFKSNESLPDSTMEIHSEVSSDVTSTLNDGDKVLKDSVTPCSSQKDASTFESLGSLLSMLQDKAKIKELLSMLGDQSESEKIKKKLEKLSEIVSDDEDANDSQCKASDKTLSSETLSNSQTIQPDSKTSNDADKPEKALDAHCSDELPPVEHVVDNQCNENINDDDSNQQLNQESDVSNKKSPKKVKMTRKTRGKGKRTKAIQKRINKSYSVKLQPAGSKPKKSTELQKLQNDIKEMFMCDDVLNATGIRMCRLSKMVDKKEEKPLKDNEPVVLLEKFKSVDVVEKKVRKKPGPKPKPKIVIDSTVSNKEKLSKPEDKPIKSKAYKPGPKSKTKQKVRSSDPYEFETDSFADTNTTKDSEITGQSSDSDSESLASSESFGSSENLADIKKKPKKKRGSWQTGVIKPRHKKKKESDLIHPSKNSLALTSPTPPRKPVTIPDMNCFTDKSYCFQHGVFTYDCRLCHYSGTEIVNHYKKHHAHTEVPLSRMDPKTAKRAIQQVCSEEVNFQAISKIPSDKYTCRFCYKEFGRKRGRGVALESFFWHVVSMHTGEYKHLCYECVNVTRCPFNLDIPPPPKDIKGQLIGYICGKCNFTQISLENLKTHVIYRHNDDQTEVYSINLGVMTQKAMKAMQNKSLGEEHRPRTLRSSRSIQSAVEGSDDRSEITISDRLSDVGSLVPKTEPEPRADVALGVQKRKTAGAMKSKLTFEADDHKRNKESVKMEEAEHPGDEYPNDSALDDTCNDTTPLDQGFDLDNDRSDEIRNESSLKDHSNNKAARSKTTTTTDQIVGISKTMRAVSKPRKTTDVCEEPHFKLNYKETGAKEYICCVNGLYHYKTTLLISLKQHVRAKHLENWDGYCCVCKVIVTLQGVQSSFLDCLTHFLLKHMDDFPILEQVIESTNIDSRSSLRSSIDASNVERIKSPKTYIAVRPLSDLISKDTDADPPMCDDNESAFPVIENVVTVGGTTVEVPKSSPVYPTTSVKTAEQPKQFQYEETQAKVMSNKHRIVLDAMMPREVLVRVFKCAGRFCSFTSDSLDEALVHASAHKQLGGEGALDCAYCNFDASGNAIDMVMHVFKEHGRCQFACFLCFYRAADVQLVGVHFAKVHGTSGKDAGGLRSTYIVPSTSAVPSHMMPRETAVPYYICDHGGGSCKFRTYTPGKFHDHMIQKHASEEKYPCNLCEFTTPTPTELIMHMKTHDLKLYQCTWCVHGANNESEMLSHAASVHPAEKPQAYLRIITNKDGPKGPRVLPLIHLNQFKVPTEDVTPSNVKEDPTKEAERSIELEKLIKHTNQLRDTQTTCAVPISETLDEAETEAQAELTDEMSDLPDQQTDEARERSLLASPGQTVQKENELNVIKMETTETPYINRKTECIVYCLDSDEEELVTQSKATAESVIDLSDEPVDKSDQTTTMKQLLSQHDQVKEPTKPDKPKFKKLTLDALFKCPNCVQIYKNIGGLKRHLNNCCIELSTFQCPHAPCPIVLSNATQLINHYNKDHNILTIAKQHYCAICKSRWSTLNATKKHLKDSHGIFKVVITSKYLEDGSCSFTVDKEERAAPTREMPSRKSSLDTPKKFGIDDIDKLPINPILDSLVYCGVCEFSTKVRLNMVRHLQLHAERQPAPQTAPVNPVPHLETNEKHFDRMVNLASSSAATARERPVSAAPGPSVAAEAVSRYPRHVPERQRLTCGARGCAYISIDEAMLRIHWETLHPGAVDFHCVHCPPHQHLDTTKILTASRILAHLKMHDSNMYACSTCSYYHYRKQVVEKHIADVHKEKGGQVQIVREEGTPPSAVGTMDLKPWQCGLCQFKSMLRQAVVEHCSSQHHTKMPFKCAYCPFRASVIESITKHQANSHPNKPADVFYFYYREGTVPDEADGTTRWQRQRQKSGIEDTGVKTEPEPDFTPVQTGFPKTASIDLNLVKKETVDVSQNISVEELCKLYGKFCDPNGISYKCSLCRTVIEYTREAMQSHLYEELNYRRWGCALCTYKAYHRAGLTDHMTSEHRGNFIEPSELSPDVNIETWVSKLLDHQSAIIERNKSNAMQKMAVEKPVAAGPSKVTPEQPKPVQVSSDIELEQAFGSLGSPKDDSYCCPKCKTTIREEDQMRNHLESELTKIRWCCTKCTDKFATFHEAQFHCKSHPGLLTRPKEAIRDSSLRNAWITAVISAQKTCMKPHDTAHGFNEDPSDNSDNSLLVVRYEEAAPTEEQLRDIAREQQQQETRKRPALSESDSEDDDSLVIHEPEAKRGNKRQCPYCDFVSTSTKQYKLILTEHILRHYNLRLMTCNYCQFNGNRRQMYNHMTEQHLGLKPDYRHTKIPNCLPNEYNLRQYTKKPEKKDKRPEDETPLKACLHCEALVSSDEMITHLHGNRPTEFGDKGEVVVKCCICLTLRKNLPSMQEHYKQAHGDIQNLNYAFYKLQVDTREVHACGICNRRFTFLRDLKIHHMSMHAAFALSYKTVPYRPDEDDHEVRGKRKLDSFNSVIRIAKKSTAKLPYNNTIAKKSTTKLPFAVDSDSDANDEYSYYGTRPVSFDEYENVKTMMPMYNTMVEIDVRNLSGILKIDPKVVVPDCRK